MGMKEYVQNWDGRLIDGSGKRIDGIRMLVGRAVNALPSLIHSGGEF
jgi:hypothetical protein